jgi:hypothetical protein
MRAAVQGRAHAWTTTTTTPPGAMRGRALVLVAALLLQLLLLAAAGGAGAAATERKAHNYEDALRKSLLYFEAQRSGRLPHNQRVAWRDHSGLTDGLEQGVHGRTLLHCAARIRWLDCY